MEGSAIFNEMEINRTIATLRWFGSGEDWYLWVGASSCLPEMAISQSNIPATLSCAGSTYTLQENITTDDETSLTIAADNVTMDCAGHSILSSGTFAISSTYNGTVVENCVITGAPVAVWYQGVSNGLIRNITASGPEIDAGMVTILNGANVNLTGSMITSEGVALSISEFQGATITYTNFTAVSNAIYQYNSNDSVFSSIRATSTEQTAMRIYDSPGTQVFHSRLESNSNNTDYSALLLEDAGGEMLTDNGVFVNNTLITHEAGVAGIYIAGVSNKNNTFLDNSIYADVWVISNTNEGEVNYFNDSFMGNAYYFANGTPSWEVYNISSSTHGSRANLGSDLPFGSTLPSPGTYLLEQWGIPDSPSGWVNGDYVNDQNWSTGSVPETDSAQLTKLYIRSASARNVSVKVGTALGTIVLPIPDDGYDGISTRINIISHLDPAQVVVYYSAGIFGEFHLLYEINGTSQLHDSSIIMTMDLQSPWAGTGEDWHPYLGAHPNVFGKGSSVNTSGSSNLTNVTATISGDPNINETEQEGVKTVNISNSGETLFFFDFNFTGAELNFSDVHIEQGTDANGNAYASITGINSSNIVGGKTLYMYNANPAIANVCVKDEEGAVHASISLTCTGTNEHNLACDGAPHSGYTCTYSGTTAIITGLHNSAAMQFSGSTPAPSQSGGSSNGGGSVGGSGGPSSTKQSANYSVDVGNGKTCTVTITRSMASTTPLSTLTTTLENVGGNGCSMTDFVFADTIPAEFPALNDVTFNPQYASRDGWKVTFNFPTFAAGESKTLIYSANQWIKTSLAKNFTVYTMTAKKQIAAPTTPAPAAPEEPSVWIPRTLPTQPERPATSASIGPQPLPPETPSIFGFVFMFGAVAVVAGAVFFFVMKGRKKKES